MSLSAGYCYIVVDLQSSFVYLTFKAALAYIVV